MTASDVDADLDIVEVPMTRRDVQQVYSLVSARRKKVLRGRIKSDYIPEPGKRHGGDVRLAALTKIMERLAPFLPREDRG